MPVYSLLAPYSLTGIHDSTSEGLLRLWKRFAVKKDIPRCNLVAENPLGLVDTQKYENLH